MRLHYHWTGKRFFVFYFLISIVITSNLFAQSSGGIEWRPFTLEGVSILSLVSHPTNPFTLYAVIDPHGIYKTTDGGKTWQAKNKGIEGVVILCLSIADEAGKVLYAGSMHNGIFKSIDGGESWVSLTETKARFSYVLSLGVVHDPVVYAGTAGNKGIYRSDDGGNNWNPVNKDLPPNLVVWSILLHPQLKEILYIGTNLGIYKSDDGGKSWQIKSEYPTTSLIFGATQKILFAGGTLGIYLSEDEGESWNIHPASQPTRDGLWGIETLMIQENSLYAGGYGGIYEVSGKQYKGNRNGKGLPENGLVVQGIVKCGERLCIGTGWGIFATHNNGDSWGKVVGGLPEEGLIVKSITFGSGKDTNLYVGTWGGGIFKKKDIESPWEPMNFGVTIPHVTQLRANDNFLYGTSWLGFGVSKDQGKSWESIFSYNTLKDMDIPSRHFEHCEKLVFSQATEKGIFFGIIKITKEMQNQEWKSVGRLITSQDDGEKWQGVFLHENVAELGEAYDVVDVVVNPKKKNIVYIVYSNPEENGILISEDNGTTWKRFNQGLEEGTFVSSLAAGGKRGDVLFAGADVGIYRREFNGNWEKTIPGSYHRVVPDPYCYERVYGFHNDGTLIFSQNSGKDWQSAGFIDFKINDLTINPKDCNIIYAATEGQSVKWANVEGIFPKTFNWTLYVITPSSVLTLLVVAIFLLYYFKKEKIDPLEIAKQFFAQAGFERVESLSNHFLRLHAAKNQMPGIVVSWHEGCDIQSLADTVRQYTEQSEKKFKLYLVHSEQKLTTQAHQLRELIRCEIIPVQTSHLARILKTQSKEGIIEHLKELEEPILTRLDPYADFKPIHNLDWFYGRDEFMRRLPAVLIQRQHVGIFGLRKVGKTSLIRQIQQRFVTTIPTIYIDCQAFYPEAEKYFEEILTQLHEELRTHNIKSLPVYKGTQDIEDFRRQFLHLFTRWKKAGQHEPFLLIFDEIDKFFPNRKLKDSETILTEYVRFFKVLRGLAQTHQCLVTLVVAYRPDINRHNLLDETIGENPMFKSFREEFLGFLALPESTKMIQEIGRWKDITWEDNAVRKVFYYCGGHPLVTRYFASMTCEEGSLKHVTLEKVEHTAEHIRKTFHKNEIGNYYKEGIWNLMTKDEQEVLALIVQAEESNIIESHIPSDLEDALTNLEHFGLVAHEQGALHLTADLFAFWLKRRLGV